jgi:hypothetical protein
LVDISIPAGALGMLTDGITKFLFLGSYQVSHQEHLKRLQVGRRFEELGEFFEFGIHLECDHLSNITVPKSILMLRNRSSRIFERVALLVEATSSHSKYQDFTTLIDVGVTPLVVYLTKIPLKEIAVSDSNRITRSYDHVIVTLFIKDSEIPEYKTKVTSWPIKPSYTEFLNSSWDKKWGAVWNLDYIESCKTRLRNKLQHYLVSRNRWPVVGESSCHRMYRILQLMLGMLLFRILGHKWVVLSIFWLPIFVHYRKLEPRNDD